MKDRTYYRQCEPSQLVEEAMYNPNIELCIVLAEVLDATKFTEEAMAEIEGLEKERDGLEAENSNLRLLNRELGDRVDGLEAQVAELEAQLKKED